MIWFNIGNILHKRGRLADARHCYGMAILLDTAYVEALTNTGALHFSEKRDDSALVYFNRSLSIDSTASVTWYNKAQVLNMQGRKTESLVCFRRALDLNPAYCSAWLSAATLLLEMGEHREARRSFAEYDDCAPPDHSGRGAFERSRREVEQMPPP